MAEPASDAELGDPAYGSDPPSMTYETAEAIDAGDVVNIDSGQARAANSNDTNSTLCGVAGEAASGSGENITIYIGGLIVANAGGSLTNGAEVAASTTDGQLTSGTNTRGWVAVTDSGNMQGLSHGAGLGDNAAVVDLG